MYVISLLGDKSIPRDRAKCVMYVLVPRSLIDSSITNQILQFCNKIFIFLIGDASTYCYLHFRICLGIYHRHLRGLNGDDSCCYCLLHYNLVEMLTSFSPLYEVSTTASSILKVYPILYSLSCFRLYVADFFVLHL
jgi:hypothetical protein